MGEPHRVGIVGLGVISAAYLDTLKDSPSVRITAVADLDAARAADAAAGLPHARAMTVDELLTSADVDAVLNLTIPAAHAEIALRALGNGKDVYGEKPLAASLAQATEVVAAARSSGRRVGCAPDTVLGTGTQTSRSVVERGVLGTPVGAAATWTSPGHEAWHPNPDFYYRDGGGPLLDMGPYYLSSLCQILGPVAAVTGAGSRRRARRTIASGPRAGETVPVEVDTHVAGMLEHVSGAISTITVSFDSAPSLAPNIEIFGEEGSLAVPDPNTFGGDVRVTDARSRTTVVLEDEAGYADAARGVGLIDFLRRRDGGRASGDLALHVMEVMTGILDSARDQRRVVIETSPAIPPLVPLTARSEWLALA